MGSEIVPELLNVGLRCLCCLPPLVVGVVHVEEHVPAGDARVQLGADEEGAGHLAVERVGLLGRRGEAVAQHDGYKALNALGGALRTEVEGLRGGEGFTQDHHCLHVGILEGLGGREGHVLTWIFVCRVRLVT